MLDLLNLFRKRRIRLIQKETVATRKLIDAQAVLNKLLREENEIQQEKTA